MLRLRDKAITTHTDDQSDTTLVEMMCLRIAKDSAKRDGTATTRARITRMCLIAETKINETNCPVLTEC